MTSIPMISVLIGLFSSILSNKWGFQVSEKYINKYMSNNMFTQNDIQRCRLLDI